MSGIAYPVLHSRKTVCYFFLLSFGLGIVWWSKRANRDLPDHDYPIRSPFSIPYKGPKGPTLVSFSLVGIDAHFTDEFLQVLKASKEENAQTVFDEMLSSTDTAIQSYGLIGLKLIGSSQYEDWRITLENSRNQVLYAPGGCVIFMEDIKKVVNDIDLLTTASRDVLDRLARERSAPAQGP